MKSLNSNGNSSVENFAIRTATAVALAGMPLVQARRDVALLTGRNGLASAEETEDFMAEAVQSAGFDFLESLKNEAGYLNHPDIVSTRKEEQRLARERAEKVRDEGLTTEINTSRDAVSIHDTLENCAAILKRHPFGYRDNFTPEEDTEAAQAMARTTVKQTEAELVEA